MNTEVKLAPELEMICVSNIGLGNTCDKCPLDFVCKASQGEDCADKMNEYFGLNEEAGSDE